MLRRWFLTVNSLMKSASAISLLRLRAATICRISVSRGVSAGVAGVGVCCANSCRRRVARRREIGASPTRQAAERLDEFRAVDVLEEIPLRPAADRGEEFVVRVMHGEHDDGHIRQRRRDPLGRRESVHHRHIHVHQDEVRHDPARLLDRLRPVARLAHDLEIRLRLEQPLQPLPQQRVVVREEDPRHGECLSPAVPSGQHEF